MTADLFPETLLVSCEHDRVFTTSLKIAEHFRKQHQHVLRTIRAIIDASPEDVWRSNFGPRDYLDERGKTQPFYELTHDGFAIAVMGFTGPAALAWKWQFLAAFRELERQLRAVRERDATALQLRGLLYRRDLTVAAWARGRGYEPGTAQRVILRWARHPGGDPHPGPHSPRPLPRPWHPDPPRHRLDRGRTNRCPAAAPNPPFTPAGGWPAPSEDSPMTADLFPETLLVSCEDDRVFTTSLQVAEHFHKRHTHVLRAVESLLKDLLSEPQIGSSEEFAGLILSPARSSLSPKLGRVRGLASPILGRLAP
ncbi:MAG: Rha family transcriptional regulator [Chromatiaceae bacterium]|nr:Rha family transcriptional regulator [Chromatiaceae bacterium]